MNKRLSLALLDNLHSRKQRLSLAVSHLKKPAEFRYSLAITLVFAAFLITDLIPELMVQHVFDLFIGAIFFIAWYVGFGPSVLAIVLSIPIIDYFFLPPINAFGCSVENVIRLTVFAFVAFLISSLSARLRRVQSELQNARDELEARVAQRTHDLSLTNARLQEEIVHRLDAEKEILQTSNREQRRLGEDLHDGLCQTLVGVRLLSRELKENLEAENPQRVDDIARIETHLSEALMQADIISRGLYPVELETNGLMAALQELAEKTSIVHRCSCQFICRKPLFFENSAMANYLYRITQEAVSNSLKRGKAKRIRIRLCQRGAAILLSITDDGIGFQADHARHGMGLKIMGYRARMINANIKIRSRQKGVTRVICFFKKDFL